MWYIDWPMDVLLRRATIKQHDLHVRLILLMEPVDGKNTYIPMPGYVRKKSVRASIFCKHFANFTPEYGFFCFSYLGFMLWASLPFHRALIHASTTILGEVMKFDRFDRTRRRPFWKVLNSIVLPFLLQFHNIGVQSFLQVLHTCL